MRRRKWDVQTIALLIFLAFVFLPMVYWYWHLMWAPMFGGGE